MLVKNEFFSEEGLKRWNASTDAALDTFTATYGESFQINYIRNSLNLNKEDTLPNHSVLLREKYIDFMRGNDSLGDSIPYDSFYLLELHMSGEEVFIGKYLIINEEDTSSFFFARYGQGNWLPLTSTKDEVYELNRFLRDVPSYTEKYAFGGEMGEYVIITKFAGEEVTSKIITSLTWENTSWLMSMLPNSLQVD